MHASFRCRVADGLALASEELVRKIWKETRQLFWSIDALLFVLMYTALLLLIPTPSPRWRRFTRNRS